MSKFNIEETLRRMRKIYAVEMNKDLSVALEIGKSTISGWISRNAIPNEVLFKVSEEKNVSLDWLVYGKEEQGRKLDPLEELALVAFNALDDKGKINALSLMNGHSQSSPSNSISQNAGDNSVNNVFSGGDAINNK